mmetsp:Transcript_478/g.1110  ORF Transcript_478/g.1110 Transcript_478/m.1110 type:complete len:201 (-) Transcript_478:1333-1935(-)
MIDNASTIFVNSGCWDGNHIGCQFATGIAAQKYSVVMTRLVETSVFVNKNLVGISRALVPFNGTKGLSQQYFLTVIIRCVVALFECVLASEAVGTFSIQAEIQRMKGDHNGAGSHRSKNPRNVIIEEPFVLVLTRSLGENSIEIIHISSCDSFCQKILLVWIFQTSKSQIHLPNLGARVVCAIVFRIHASAEFICDFVSI